MRTVVLLVCCCSVLGRRAALVRDGRENSVRTLTELLLASKSPGSMSQAAIQSRDVRGSIPVAEAVPRRQAMTQQAAVLGVTLIPAAANAEGGNYPKVKIQTTEGDMEFDMWNDVAPETVKSFLKLTKDGFYDGGCFHRIIPGFVIQGGDPNAKLGYGTDGTLNGPGSNQNAQRLWGRGGPGYNIKAEFNERPHEFGVLSMARAADPNSAGSQFFVCLGRLTNLDNQYTVFGKLTSGEAVLKKLGSAERGAGDKPLQRQGIEKVEVLSPGSSTPGSSTTYVEVEALVKALKK